MKWRWRSGSPGWSLAVVAWGLAVGGGTVAMARYSLTPGAAREAPGLWPSDSQVPRTPGRPTLVMLAHPRCPCTRASMEELEVLMAHARGRVDAFVLFLRPEGTGQDWEEGELWRRAAAIPGVAVLEDADGVEARRFGAVTSGHVVFFDGTGRERFSGGITPSRGHVGDNVGRAALESLLWEGTPVAVADTSAVYGCSLESPPEGAR